MTKATEQQKAKRRERYALLDKEVKKKKGHDYYIKNYEKHRALRNSDEFKEKLRLQRSTPEGWAKYSVYNCRARAKFKNLEFDLTIADLVKILPERCPVLGMPLVLGATGSSYKDRPDSPSVDRLDNSKGYTKDNVRVISLRANLIKNDATLEELEGVLRYMKEELNNTQR